VLFSNELNSRYTVLEVQALDRLGLLYDIFRILGSHSIEVAVARILTEKGAAIDTFYVTDVEGRKLKDSKSVARLQEALREASQQISTAAAVERG
jgi:[protein-PII] uridylyltransferase